VEITCFTELCDSLRLLDTIHTGRHDSELLARCQEDARGHVYGFYGPLYSIERQLAGQSKRWSDDAQDHQQPQPTSRLSGIHFGISAHEVMKNENRPRQGKGGKRSPEHPSNSQPLVHVEEKRRVTSLCIHHMTSLYQTAAISSSLNHQERHSQIVGRSGMSLDRPYCFVSRGSRFVRQGCRGDTVWLLWWRGMAGRRSKRRKGYPSPAGCFLKFRFRPFFEFTPIAQAEPEQREGSGWALRP
jgi:hypothetical protein